MPDPRSKPFGLAVALSVLTLAACAPLERPAPAAAAGGLPERPLPLGAPDLAETRSVEQLAPGLRHHHLYRGERSRDRHWVVSSPVARTPAEQASARACLARAGVAAVAAEYRTPGSRPTPYTVFQGGSFRTEAAARAAIPPALVGECRLSVQHSSGDPQASGGPWSIHIVEIDPRRYRGRLISALGQGVVAGVERTSDLARRHRALAAINGGFFVMRPEEGVVGEPAGIAVIEGRIRSEPTQDRPYLVLRDGAPVAAEIVGEPRPGGLAVRWADGSRSRIDGVDRRPNLIRNCGTPGSRPTELPMHDVTCSNPNELVALTEGAGFGMDQPQARALLVHPDGRAEPASASTPPGMGQILLVATGSRAAELVGRTRASIDLSYRRLDPRIAARGSSRIHAVNGGPLLIREGAAVRREDREGWLMAPDTDPARATMVHNWVNRRNPRTAAGVMADGRIYLVAVDGREFEGEGREGSPGSVGLTIEELRTLMAWLGVRDAINLDGGGSTALAIGGRLVNRPSDRAGERPVGDAILLLPRELPENWRRSR